MEKVRRFSAKHRLLQPGDRVAVAVSGGADSVALLRVLFELREELGLVLSVAHFNHQIRGAEADADEQFTSALARQLALEFHSSCADVPAFAQASKLSIETAARELRHEWFAQLLREGKAEKIATAHTLDDQVETVLMRVVRGAGTRGLAGISPWQREKALIRPLLAVTRKEVEAYLHSLHQPWREDLSNRDMAHTRNRVRHELLPLLEQHYNPGIRNTLDDLAEVARGEEEYWEQESASLLSRWVREGKPTRGGGRSSQTDAETLAVDLSALKALPLAAQRRLVRAMGERLHSTLEFRHVDQLLQLSAAGEPGTRLELPGGLGASRSFRELQLSRGHMALPEPYCYRLPVPGEINIPELGTTIRARLMDSPRTDSRYSSPLLLDRARLSPELTVRSWRAGDRFFPAHTQSPRKIKELLQSSRLGRAITSAERKSWPVVESAGEIVWMRGFPLPKAFAIQAGPGILIEELN
ncbi:MAG TPA: tRNA lysidine(34) synthetase TilS [Candidatus Angelobacter sp.]|nr:tRNA lysidine(34) synthetase TilS [Candidatus Angelobacter sp.]